MHVLSRSEFIGLALATAAAPLADTSADAAEPRRHTFLVASDPHYISQRLTDNGPKFTELVSEADGKVMLKIDPLLDAFVEQVLALSPEALVISGDLSFNGALASHEDLAAKLAKLLNAGIRVAVVPGNHDIDYPFAASFEGDSYTAATRCTAQDFRRVWARFGYDDALSEDPASLSYLYPLFDDLWLLMVDCNATADPGALTDETLDWCRQALQAARDAGVRVVGVSHQNLLGHCDLFGDGFMMIGADGLDALYADYGVRFHLSGHIHIQHSLASGTSSVFEVVTSSLAVTPNQFALVDVEGGTLSYRMQPVDVATWAQANSAGATDPDLLDFAAYSEDFFKHSSRVNCEDELVEAGLAQEDAHESAEAVAEMNRLYFAGRTDLVDWSDPALTRALGKTSLEDYLQFVRSEPPADHTRADVEL